MKKKVGYFAGLHLRFTPEARTEIVRLVRFVRRTSALAAVLILHAFGIEVLPQSYAITAISLFAVCALLDILIKSVANKRRAAERAQDEEKQKLDKTTGEQ